MTVIPRLALAVPITGSEPSPASLGLMAGLNQLGWRIQHFRTRACPTGTKVISQVTGWPGRHLDAWLMPSDVCRAVFARGTCGSDLAVVEGTLEEPELSRPLDCEHHGRPGNLGPIIRDLNLPTVALISCPRWEGMHLPNLPPEVDAVLIDNLESAADYPRIEAAIRHALKKPVLGAVEALPETRRALAALPRDQPVPDELFAPLARSFLRFADLDVIHAVSTDRPYPVVCGLRNMSCGSKFRVAYAQDEAFGGYFPDTLETLETLGAELVEFSPLKSEGLPEAADLVMIGCGFPDRFADALASNYCLIEAIRAHVYQGRRIYSEGGGTAYLGRSFRFEDREVAGVGILPIDAILRDEARAPYPVVLNLRSDTWLGPSGTVVRGYNAGRWDVKPTSELCHRSAGFGPVAEGSELFYHHHAVGSLVHLHLAALPQVVAAFAGPHRPSLTRRQVN